MKIQQIAATSPLPFNTLSPVPDFACMVGFGVTISVNINHATEFINAVPTYRREWKSSFSFKFLQLLNASNNR